MNFAPLASRFSHASLNELTSALLIYFLMLLLCVRGEMGVNHNIITERRSFGAEREEKRNL